MRDELQLWGECKHGVIGPHSIPLGHPDILNTPCLGKKVTLRRVTALVAIDLPDELRQPGFAPHEERMLYEIVEDTDD